MLKQLLRAALIGCVTCCAETGLLRYEAEDCVVTQDAVVKNTFPPDKWALWTTDVDAHKKWSGGEVLKSPVVTSDRGTPEAGAPPLQLVLKGIPDGVYDVRVKRARALAVSLDGNNWQRLEGDVIAREIRVRTGTFTFWIDDRFAEAKPEHRGSSYLDWIEVESRAAYLKGVWNGGFEVLRAGQPNGWALPKSSDTMDAKLIQDDVHSGKHAVRIKTTVDGKTRWDFGCAKRTPVKPGGTMRVSAWAKGTIEQTAWVRVDGLNDGTLVKRFVGRVCLESATSWTCFNSYLKIPEGVNELGISVMAYGPADLLLDDVSIEPGTLQEIRGTKVNGWARARVTEKLDRGVVALRTPQGAYVSWRLLATDPEDVAFDVFRIVNDGAWIKLNTTPIIRTCDFSDEDVPDPAGVLYWIVPGNGVEPSGRAPLPPRTDGAAHIKIPLKDPEMQINRIGIGDLDGDGASDFVVKHPNKGTDPYHSFWKASAVTYKLDAYTSAGNFLWRRDLGWAIETGIWYSPFVVCDINGDGRAEVIAKTGEGDPRDKDGRVFSGPEWLTVMDGRTGRDLCRTPWPTRRGFSGYNTAARNQLAIAYLDGKTPCILALRGTYGRMKVDAHQVRNGTLEKLWSYDNAQYPTEYWGQGAHTTRIADVDADGRDEILLGSVCLDDDGTSLWTTGRGHPDGAHLGDILPNRPGLEVFYCMETAQSVDGGLSLVDAATGEFIWKLQGPTRHVHSGGMCADLDASVPGRECYGADTDEDKRSNRGWLMSAAGKELQTGVIYGATMPTIFWDADLQREILRSGVKDHGGSPLEARPGRGKIVDILGDWREEVVSSAPGEIRIYSTTIPAMDRRVCLLQDPIYRACVRMSSMGYEISPTPTAPFSATAPNLNLTFVQNEDGEACRIVVSAPPATRAVPAQSRRGLRGTLSLQPDAVFQLAKDTFDIDLAPGEHLEQTVAISTPAAGKAQEGRILAKLRTEDGVLRGQVWIKATGKPNTTGALVEAEDLSAEEGGTVHIRTDKANVRGGAISHWDRKGHALEWHVDIPVAGRYEFLVRYCAPHEAKRRLSVNGEDIRELTFPVSGGFGDQPEDWDEVTFLRTKSTHFQLKKGRHTIRLENISDTGMNLDYLGFVKH